MPWHIPESLLKTEKLRRRRRRKGRKAELLAEQLQAGDGVRAPREAGRGGLQSWKGAARSRHPSASEPRPPGGPEEGGQRTGAQRDRKGAVRRCLPPGPRCLLLCYLLTVLMPETLALVPSPSCS